MVAMCKVEGVAVTFECMVVGIEAGVHVYEMVGGVLCIITVSLCSGDDDGILAAGVLPISCVCEGTLRCCVITLGVDPLDGLTHDPVDILASTGVDIPGSYSSKQSDEG